MGIGYSDEETLWGQIIRRGYYWGPDIQTRKLLGIGYLDEEIIGDRIFRREKYWGSDI